MQISEIVKTSEFWFVAVFVGLSISVIGNLVTNFIRTKFSKLVTSWDNRNKRSKEKRELLILKYSESYQQLYLGKLEQNHKKLEVIYYISATVLLLAYGQLGSLKSLKDIALVISLFSSFASLLAIISHGRFMLIITEAETKLNEPKETM